MAILSQYRKQFVALIALVAVVAALLPFAGNTASAQAVVCGEPKVVTLFAGQTIDAGSVTVSNDETNLYVTFNTTGDWWLQKTHLHVADSLAGIPTTRKGNPKVGNFDYQTAHNPLVQSHTYTIAKSDLSLDENESLVIAAHAEVVKLDGDGNVIQSETGWGDGDTFVDRGSWATYFSYSWQPCDEDPEDPDSKTQTAFARLLLDPYGTNERSDDQVTCFLDLDTDNDASSRNQGDTDEISRWGWTNGALVEDTYTFELWAGAAKCDNSKGTFVGTVTLTYSGGTATVSFNTTGTNGDTLLPYELTETHLYIGNEVLPFVSGSYTVAPGSYKDTTFGQIHGELDNLTSDSYTITGLSGEIYVVAHATVAGFPMD